MGKIKFIEKISAKLIGNALTKSNNELTQNNKNTVKNYQETNSTIEFDNEGKISEVHSNISSEADQSINKVAKMPSKFGNNKPTFEKTPDYVLAKNDDNNKQKQSK